MAQAMKEVVADPRRPPGVGFMLIQNASDSIRPPLRPSMRTRFSHHRVEVAEHQRRNRNRSGNSIGLIRSIMVRRTIHSGWQRSVRLRHTPRFPPLQLVVVDQFEHRLSGYAHHRYDEAAGDVGAVVVRRSVTVLS